jgi:3-keto-L-gulonate-6-phosphate decarboxylase
VPEELTDEQKRLAIGDAYIAYHKAKDAEEYDDSGKSLAKLEEVSEGLFNVLYDMASEYLTPKKQRRSCLLK